MLVLIYLVSSHIVVLIEHLHVSIIVLRSHLSNVIARMPTTLCTNRLFLGLNILLILHDYLLLVASIEILRVLGLALWLAAY